MPEAPAWSDDLLSNPHAVADKRSRVREMFAAIAPSYDLNNRLHSFGRDQAWRRAAVKLADLKPTDAVVDVACGTGDLTVAFANEVHRLARLERQTTKRDSWTDPLPVPVLGIDFTYEMLPSNGQKTPSWHFGVYKDEHGQPILGDVWLQGTRYLNGDAQQLPLPDACCDVVSIAFGIRNVQNVDAALREFYRVLRPGGRVIVLEFSEPTNPVLRALNRFYCGRVMPVTATLISRDKSGAYKYLPKSVETFMTRQQMTDHLTAAGFGDITLKPMTFGVCVAYRGVKA
ncbi:MAG: class I SAM-dependent methyltransferase [Tepidisphaeraceae bacterium]